MILLNDSFVDDNFKNFKDQIIEINTHYNDCRFRGRSIPIDVCSCDCYVKQIFRLGMKAQEELFYGGNDRVRNLAR